MRVGDGVIARRNIDPGYGPVVPQGMFGTITQTYNGKVTVRFDNGARITDLTENDVK